MSRTLLITGASGPLGRAALAELVRITKGDTIIAASRSPEKIEAPAGVQTRRADFDDDKSLDQAFAGVDRLLLISTDALDDKGTRARQHKAAVAAAKRAGVKHVVYTSAPRADSSPLALAPDHKATEEALKESGLGYTVLRHNWYAQLLLASVPPAVASGQFFTAAGDGRIGYITREDCAAADAAALASDFEGQRIIELTGPEALNAADVAKLASEITGKPVAAVQLTEAQMADGLQKAGLPAPAAALFARVDTNVKDGALDLVTDAFEKLTGRQPTTVRAFLEANKAALG